MKVVPPEFEDEEEPGPWQRRLWGDPDRPYAARGWVVVVAFLLVLALLLSLLADLI